VIDFSDLAGRYDTLRPAGEGWQQLADASLELLDRPARLLDVGCGTGRFTVLAAGRLGGRVWGVDPSEAMLAQARAQPGGARVGWKRAAAERLPFRDAWFDGVHLHLVLHVLDDRAAGLTELARVLAPGGRLVAVTFRPEHFTGFYLNRYFPSIPAIDAARFPDPDALLAQLAGAGFADVRLIPLDQPVQPDPDALLERVRGRYISTLHLLDEAEYTAGVRMLEADLAAGVRPGGTLRWLLVAAVRGRPAG
jgi:SAM-dependent methyltransferase